MFFQALRSLKLGARRSSRRAAEPPPAAQPFVVLPVDERAIRIRLLSVEVARLDEFVEHAATFAAWARTRADAHRTAAALLSVNGTTPCPADAIAAAHLATAAVEAEHIALEVSDTAARLDTLRHLLAGARVVPLPKTRQ
ncbi:conserved protein of unknown function (plasmid) [Rhodovastum atsumiense]|uniref:Uncharacterized protein n=1 Tax=Rhodovastum atsumiense TaxID=504468 RepID=A0A5M6ITB1_9PROT|nr:hypothetical protein [Rhodovastum atsumiense]KAA5611553.1 hypothetical protein F1189_13390 [Rhodovastum atsumiense]CAH2606219.1 conserved protein of unknown function [Rhodovastum atsumiense]